MWKFDAEFKFANIQNCHVEEGGRSWNFDAELKFAIIQNSHFAIKKKKKKKNCKKFSKFSGKKHNGFVLDFEYQVVPLYEV